MADAPTDGERLDLLSVSIVEIASRVAAMARETADQRVLCVYATELEVAPGGLPWAPRAWRRERTFASQAEAEANVEYQLRDPAKRRLFLGRWAILTPSEATERCGDG